MNKIKTIAAAGVLFLLASASFAEGLSLESVCSSLASHPTMTGSFSQTKTIKAVNRALKSSGTFIFSLEGIMWKTEKPFPSVLAVGQKSVIQTSPDGKKTVIDASSNQIFTSISSTLFALFSGKPEVLNQNFNVDFSAEGLNWEIRLTPKDSTVAEVLKELAVSGKASGSFSELNRIVMTEASDDTITYAFTDQKYPEELTADEKAYFNEE